MDESDFMTANAVDTIQQAQNQGNNSSIQQPANHRRSSSFKLTRVLSRKSSSKSSRKNKNRPIINTLPIIQPQPYWNYSGPGSRVFKINLHNPRQQVTSLLALSSVPRPVTPPHEEFESSSTLISNATRAAIEEEETRAAIAASLITFASQNASNFSSSETDTCEEEDDFLDTIPVLPRGTQTFHHSRVLTSLSSSVHSNEMVNDSGNVSGLSTREQQSPNSFHSAAAVSIIHQPSSNSLVLGNDPTIGSIQDADELSDGMGYLRMGRRRRASQVEAASAGSSSSSSSSSASGTVPVTLAGDELHSSSSISSLRNSLISTTSGRSSSSSVMSNICDICQSCKTYASECHAQLTKPLSQPLGVGAPAPTQTPTPGQPGVGPAGGRRSLGSRGPAPVENHRPRMRSQPSEGTSKTRNCSTTATTTTTTTTTTTATTTSNNSYLSKVSKSLADTNHQSKHSKPSNLTLPLQPRRGNSNPWRSIQQVLPVVLSPINDSEEILNSYSLVSQQQSSSSSSSSPSSLSFSSSFSSIYSSLLIIQRNSTSSPGTGTTTTTSISNTMNHQGSPSHTPPPQHTSKVSDQPDAPRQTLPAAETFIIVRPPPGKQNHPLNLQIQLILPSSQIQSQNRDQSRSSSIGTGDNSEPSQSAHAEPSQQASSSSSNTATGNLELTRTRSNRSTHSSRSNRSSLTFSSSKSETRNRRVTPLYNLVWHTVLPSLIVDAGTDAKIAKLLKRGIDIIDLASIEPNEIRASYAQDLEALISFEMSPSPTNGQFSLPSNGSNKNPSNNDRGPVTLINRIKRLGIFLKKGSNRSESGQSSENVARSTSSAAGGYGISSSLPQANGALSSVGPLAGSGRRAEGYVWIVRKWNKPEIVEWLAESSSGADQLGALLIEWRKDKKKSTRRPFSTSRPPLSEPQQSTGGIGDVQDQTPAILISSSATNSPIGPSQMSNEGETTNPGQREEQQQVSGMKNFLNRLSKSGIPNNRTEPIRLVTIDDQSRPASTDDSSNRTSQISQPPTMTEASQSRLDEESQDERNANNGVVDEDDAESDPEDSESKWHCEVVVQGKNMKTRSSVATLIPHPHHPKLVAQLNIPWNLEPIRLIDKKSNDGNDQALPQTEEDEDEMIRLSVEDVKDLVAVSCMWLIVKEELGGVGQRRKGDRGWRLGMKV